MKKDFPITPPLQTPFPYQQLPKFHMPCQPLQLTEKQQREAGDASLSEQIPMTSGILNIQPHWIQAVSCPKKWFSGHRKITRSDSVDIGGIEKMFAILEAAT